VKTLYDAWIPEFGSASGMDPDLAGFRVVGSGPDPARTKMSRSGLDPDPAGSENCGSGAPLVSVTATLLPQYFEYVYVVPLVHMSM